MMWNISIGRDGNPRELMGVLLLKMPTITASCFPFIKPRTVTSLFARCPSLQPQAIQKIVSYLTFEVLTRRHLLSSTSRNYSSVKSARFQSEAMAVENHGVGNVVVYVTVPDKDTGRNLAKSIVNERLAACVNQVPGIESTYWWQGKVETDSEELLIIKTKDSLLEALTEHVVSNHPYKVPEVIALPIIGGSPAYLRWLEENTNVEQAGHAKI